MPCWPSCRQTSPGELLHEQHCSMLLMLAINMLHLPVQAHGSYLLSSITILSV